MTLDLQTQKLEKIINGKSFYDRLIKGSIMNAKTQLYSMKQPGTLSKYKQLKNRNQFKPRKKERRKPLKLFVILIWHKINLMNILSWSKRVLKEKVPKTEGKNIKLTNRKDLIQGFGISKSLINNVKTEEQMTSNQVKTMNSDFQNLH